MHWELLGLFTYFGVSKGFLTICTLIIGSSCFSQDTVIVSGEIRARESDESIYDAYILMDDQIMDSSNPSGAYEFSTSKGNHILKITHTGYQHGQWEIDLQRDTHLIIWLEELQLPEVNVRADRILEPSLTRLEMKDLKKIPMLLGEPDPIKALTMLPGVSQGLEGFAGIVVRGGGTDQNLILMDNLQLYQKGHLLGFTSPMNQEFLESITFYKNYFPPQYDGRLSSVVQGNTISNVDSFSTEVSVGLINSGFHIGRPITKGKSKLQLGGRTSYSGFVLSPFLKSSDPHESTRTKIFFYEFTGKFEHRFQNNSSISILSQFSRDRISQLTEGKKLFPNQPTETRATHVSIPSFAISTSYQMDFGRRWHLESSLYYNSVSNRYTNEGQTPIESSLNTFEINNESNLATWGHKSILSFQEKSWSYNFGLQNEVHSIGPQKISGHLEDAGRTTNLVKNPQSLRSYVNSGFIEFEKNYREIKLYGGLRFNHYHYNDFSTSYLNPRAGIEIGYENKLSFWYVQNNQFLHSVESLNSLIPIDILLPSTGDLQPQRMSQISVEYAFSLGRTRDVRYSISTFYKKFSQLSQIRPGEQILFNLNANWTDFLVSGGEGNAAGIEVSYIQDFTKAKLNLNYTYTRSIREFPDVNAGDTFFANFDRPHYFVLNFHSSLGPHWILGLTAHYASGVPVTLPSALSNGLSGYTPVYFSKNNYRLPDYHKVDVQFSRTWVSQGQATRENTLTVGVYNAYGRKNLISIYYVGTTRRTGNVSGKFSGYSFLRFIPILSYRLSW